MNSKLIHHLKQRLESILQFTIPRPESDLTFIQLVIKASKRLDELESQNNQQKLKDKNLDLFEGKPK